MTDFITFHPEFDFEYSEGKHVVRMYDTATASSAYVFADENGFGDLYFPSFSSPVNSVVSSSSRPKDMNAVKQINDTDFLIVEQDWQTGSGTNTPYVFVLRVSSSGSFSNGDLVYLNMTGGSSGLDGFNVSVEEVDGGFLVAASNYQDGGSLAEVFRVSVNGLTVAVNGSVGTLSPVAPASAVFFVGLVRADGKTFMIRSDSGTLYGQAINGSWPSLSLGTPVSLLSSNFSFSGVSFISVSNTDYGIAFVEGEDSSASKGTYAIFVDSELNGTISNPLEGLQLQGSEVLNWSYVRRGNCFHFMHELYKPGPIKIYVDFDNQTIHDLARSDGLGDVSFGPPFRHRSRILILGNEIKIIYKSGTSLVARTVTSVPIECGAVALSVGEVDRIISAISEDDPEPIKLSSIMAE